MACAAFAIAGASRSIAALVCDLSLKLFLMRVICGIPEDSYRYEVSNPDAGAAYIAIHRDGRRTQIIFAFYHRYFLPRERPDGGY